MYPVVVGTNRERTAWLNDCLQSIRATSKPRRFIYVHKDGGFEPAAIRAGCAKFDRFLFIHDSVVIQHPDFWTAIDNSEPAWLAGWPPMMIAVYEAQDVLPHLPEHDVTKREAVQLESTLPGLLNMPTIWPDITDANHLRMEERHGRTNMVLGNELWEKYKGNWGQGPL
jgi:hypothetical protein